ncbi:hypothetical protein KV100_17905 [Mumia sp. zg.B21]|uniref:hypothetical protein n=1 Tax=Mumia sp. zg.B21 TaxID=2855447 RepID=UPI001C6F387E|nr:hypothetical protein [Mumia sp. zg.B21]MBW9211529.1 hypothetical protein [Mumia sp. zg.B21]
MNTLAADTSRALRSWIPSDVSRTQKVTAVALTLIAAQLALRTWVVSDSWFFEDDFHFLSDIAAGEDDLAWYFRPHNVHFMPLSFVLVKMVTWAGPFAWWVAAVQTVVLQAAASLSCWWMLRKLFGDRPAMLIPLAFYLFSIFSIPTLTWYAAMINQLPLHTCIFLGVAAHVAYLRTRRYRWALVATALTAVGLLFYVKAIALPMVFGLLAVLYFASGRPVRRFVAVVRRYFWGWLTYAALGAAYLAMYWVRMPRSDAGETDHAALAQSMLVDVLGTGLTGLSWTWALLGQGPRSISVPSTLLVSLSWLIVVGIWGYLYATRTRALRGLVIAVPYLLLTYAILAVGRSGTFGDVGREVRYLSDATAVLCLVLALAIMPLRGAVESSEPRDQPLVNASLSRGAVLVIVSGYVAASVWSSITYARPWHDTNPTKDFALTAIDEITKADRPALLDAPVPEAVMWSVNAPYNLPSRMFAPLGDVFTTPDQGNDLETFTAQGMLEPAEIASGTTALPGPDVGCGYSLKGDDAPVVIPLASATYDFPFWMAIGYLAGQDGYAAVSAGDNAYRVHLERGLHTLYLRTDGSYDRLTIDAGGANVCVDRVAVGPVEVKP